MRRTMIRRIWLLSGIRAALCCCSYLELRAILDHCEETLAMRPRGPKEREEWAEYAEWRIILIDEIQRRQMSWFLGVPV